MAKVTQLIPAPSRSELVRQMILAIIRLAEKKWPPQSNIRTGYTISMHAREAHARRDY